MCAVVGIRLRILTFVFTYGGGNRTQVCVSLCVCPMYVPHVCVCSNLSPPNLCIITPGLLDTQERIIQSSCPEQGSKERQLEVQRWSSTSQMLAWYTHTGSKMHTHSPRVLEAEAGRLEAKSYPEPQSQFEDSLRPRAAHTEPAQGGSHLSFCPCPSI